MRMTHIYQPVMIRTLLESRDNTATVDQIAMNFLADDQSQLNYYKKITKRWPHITLKKHRVVSYEKNKYTLSLDERLSSKQRKKLIELCNLRLEEFMENDPWIRLFREIDSSPINSSMRYDVLARSKGVCVGCGAKSTEALLHVDHIVPRSLGGPTDPHNLQALCQKCNLQKRNRDETDFMRWHKQLQFRKNDCLLCSQKDTIKSNSLAHAIRPKDLGAAGALVIPNRHVDAFVDLIPAEKQLCMILVDDIIREGKKETGSGFEVSGLDGTHDGHCRISVVSKK